MLAIVFFVRVSFVGLWLSVYGCGSSFLLDHVRIIIHCCRTRDFIHFYLSFVFSTHQFNSFHFDFDFQSDCTYSHFENSSQCPVCSKTLRDDDFTELVVAVGNGQTNDITKSSLQALFSKQSMSKGDNASKALPLSDACFTLVRQIDAVKQTTKFLLKQLLMNGNAQGKHVAHGRRENAKLKNEITQLRQEQSSQRLQFQQMNNEHINILNAKENGIRELTGKLQEKDRMLAQFRSMHGKPMLPEGHGRERERGRDVDQGSISQFSKNRNSVGAQGGGTHNVPHNNTGPLRPSNMSERNSSLSGAEAPPPLRGLVAKRNNQQAMQQQAFNRRRGPNFSSSASVQSSITGIGGGGSRMGGAGGMGHMTQRFSSSHSAGSNSLNSVTPRVRDLSNNTGFNFSGGSRGGGSRGSGNAGSGNNRLNKRRRAEPTPVVNHTMSPNTAFTLNQGNYSSTNRGQSQRWS